MDVKNRREPDDDPEPLRRLLRRYAVPAPPSAIEEELRETFRRRQSWSRSLRWLGMAAAILLAMGVLVMSRTSRTPTTVVTERPVEAPVAPTISSAPTPAPSPAVVANLATRPRRARMAPARVAPAEPEVLIEPGQLEMLRQFARGLRAVPEGSGTAGEDVDVQFVERQKGVQVPVPVALSGGEV